MWLTRHFDVAIDAAVQVFTSSSSSSTSTTLELTLPLTHSVLSSESVPGSFAVPPATTIIITAPLAGAGASSRAIGASSDDDSGGYHGGYTNGNADLKNDPSIRAARQKVSDAEAYEREADRALGQARLAVREAREHVRMLEQEVLEEARRAKAKQAEAKTSSNRIIVCVMFWVALWHVAIDLQFPTFRGLDYASTRLHCEWTHRQAERKFSVHELIRTITIRTIRVDVRITTGAWFYVLPSCAINVYLRPAPSSPVPAQLDAKHASFALARHLGLERFEKVGEGDGIWDGGLQMDSESLIGNAPQDGLLVSMSQEDARVILPKSLRPTFKMASPPLDSLTPLVRTYLHRAPQLYDTVISSFSTTPSQAAQLLDIFAAPTEANKAFLTSASALVELRHLRRIRD
ncbi:hypothetical protein NM688_g8341 [Phlebia brevispora]|uniref:Uncharacterized protein n=1 Tax=Phlebia brevispora TaxID=194682 RepID=A0ACC1RSI2_9APHY|nr:hypothetical protein NM688_g8341 [Phlebia brevispora]